MRIGKRLKKVIDVINSNEDIVFDIGTDHGFLALKLIEEKNIKKVIATDISAGSLKKAVELSKKYGLESRIECVLSDGFSNITNYLDKSVVVIAGMGGNETIKILKNCKKLSKIKYFVLQPMQDAEILREYLLLNGFTIVFDQTVKDRDKFYHVIKCMFSGDNSKVGEEDFFVGVTDKTEPTEEFKEFITQEINSLKNREDYLNSKDKIRLKTFINILSEYKNRGK